MVKSNDVTKKDIKELKQIGHQFLIIHAEY